MARDHYGGTALGEAWRALLHSIKQPLGWLDWLWRQLLRVSRNLAGYALVQLLPPAEAAAMSPPSKVWAAFSVDSSRCYRLCVDVDTPKDLRMASISDFGVRSAVPLAAPLERLLEEKIKSLMPYAYDSEHDVVVLVDIKEGEDPLEDKRFLYQAQHSRTSEVYLVPASDYVRGVDAVCSDTSVLQRTAFLHSTGRCGSTLLSKILHALGNHESLNEPDIYTCLLSTFHTGEEAGAALVGAIARAATLQLVQNRLAHCQTAETVVWIKFRSPVVHFAKLMKTYLPEVKQVYLYRNAVDYTDSACSGFITNTAFKFARYTGLDGYVVWTPRKHRLSGCMSTSEWRAYRQDLKKDRDCYNAAFRIGFVGALALAWQENMVHAQKSCLEGVFHAVLRYEELVQYREAMVLQLVERCGFTVRCKTAIDNCESEVDRAIAVDVDRVFLEDAHGGSQLQSSRVGADGCRIKETVYIKPSELDDLLAVIKHHPTVCHPDIILPGSLMTDGAE